MKSYLPSRWNWRPFWGFVDMRLFEATENTFLNKTYWILALKRQMHHIIPTNTLKITPFLAFWIHLAIILKDREINLGKPVGLNEQPSPCKNFKWEIKQQRMFLIPLYCTIRYTNPANFQFQLDKTLHKPGIFGLLQETLPLHSQCVYWCLQTWRQLECNLKLVFGTFQTYCEEWWCLTILKRLFLNQCKYRVFHKSVSGLRGLYLWPEKSYRNGFTTIR